MPEIDLYKDHTGNLFLKNEFSPLEPLFIGVNSDEWNASYKGIGQRCLFSVLPKSLRKDTKDFLCEKLKINSPSYMSRFHNAIELLSIILPKNIKNYKDLGIDDWFHIWEEATTDNKSFLREFYNWLAHRKKSDSMIQIASEINLWTARPNARTLRYVLDWDTQHGAFTSDETEVLLKLFQEENTDSVRCNAIRLFGWILFETLKRPGQVLGMKASALKVVSGKGIEEYFLAIPKAKAQSAEDTGDWRITNELASAIKRFSLLPEVSKLQEQHDRLILWKNKGLKKHGEISSATAGVGLFRWVNTQKLISPRTQKPMHVRPYRIRHTGGTRLAMQGFSVDDIMEVLEHDSKQSCQAYIDAVGAELIPALERADRNLGSLFSNLCNLFFKGKVVDKIDSDKPIYVPDCSAGAALVGSCDRKVATEGQCQHHPFHKCYSDCPHFLAWRDGDHGRALKYTEIELKRWNEAEGHKERNKNIKDFERLHKGIEEVIHQINTENV